MPQQYYQIGMTLGLRYLTTKDGRRIHGKMEWNKGFIFKMIIFTHKC